jgi:hypothetical protein
MLLAFIVGNVVAFGDSDYSQLSVPEEEVEGQVTAIGAGFRTSYIMGPDLALPPVAAPPAPGARRACCRTWCHCSVMNMRGMQVE